MKPCFLDPATVPVKIGSPHPEPFRSQVSAQRKQALGDAVVYPDVELNLSASAGLNFFHEDGTPYSCPADLNQPIEGAA